MEVAGPLGTPLGLAQRKRASPRGEAGTSGFLCVSDSDRMVKVKVESEKVGLKLNIQKTKIMASGPTTSWEMDEETVKTVSDFIFLGSKITTDGDCSHEIKRRLLLGRKVKESTCQCRRHGFDP